MKADIYSLVSLETVSCHLLSGSHQKPQFWLPLSFLPPIHSIFEHACMLMDVPAEATALCPDIFLSYFCISCLRHVLLMDLVYSCLYWLAGKLQKFTHLYPPLPPSTGVTNAHSLGTAQLLHGCWRPELGSSCFHSKHFPASSSLAPCSENICLPNHP